MQEINLYHLLKYYYKRIYLLVFYALIGFVLALIYNVFIQTASYRSTTSALISNTNQVGNTSNTTLMNNLVELTKSRAVLEKVIDNLNLDINYTQIVGAVSVENPKDSAIIRIDVVSTKPETARDVAKATLEVFDDKVDELYNGINILQIDPASLDTKPFNVKQSTQLALGTIAGLLFGILALFFVYDFKLSSGVFDKKKTPASPPRQSPQPERQNTPQASAQSPEPSIATRTIRTPTPTSVSQGNAKILNLRQKPQAEQLRSVGAQNKDRLGIGK